MGRLVRTVLLCALAAAAWLGAPPGALRADDGAESVRDRIELVRKLPPEEQRRLRDALERFKSLPPEQRRELRRRARRVGQERLRELVGRNVERLRRRHEALARERDEIVRLLGGPRRLAALGDEERDYIVDLAVRSFQKHVRRTLLSIAGPNQMEAFMQLPRDERRKKLSHAVHGLESRLLAAETPQSRAEILALPPAQRRQRIRELVAEHRLALVPSFVTIFERQRLLPFLEMSPERRAEIGRLWHARARWYEIRRRLAQEIGVSRESLRLLSRLEPEDWARLRDEYDRSETMDPTQRRLHLEEEIRRLDGGAALGSADDADDHAAADRARLRRLLRQMGRRRRTRAPR